MSKPELLAPAGGWDALVAAVENGADAVYLGGQMFNARQSADNFDHDGLSRAVEYAHLRGAKIYVTVNTLIADTEMEEALEFLYTLQKIGADAAILQDAGLASLARKALPELPLHASTQMTAHNSPGVRELLAAGFSRVVLAREMSLEQIKAIKEATGADLEVFVHGALCISYSGQCLLSSMIGGRSGNRGRCAQPCRMQYALQGWRPAPGTDRAGEYLLSPRDLNMSAYMPDLACAGINSLKIEGRMKRPEYVATVVRIYRNLMDRALSGEPYIVGRQEKENLAQIFNRDFTTGYFFGAQGRDMMSYNRPNNRGVRLGRVRGFDKNSGLVEVTLEMPLRTGDGLEIWVTEGGRVGFTADKILVGGSGVKSATAGDTACLHVPGKVRPGDRVFKTHDAELMELARDSFATPRGARRKIPLKFTVQGGTAVPLVVTATDPEGRAFSAATASTGREAEKRPLDEEYLLDLLGRLGNTPFSIDKIATDISGRVIYPAGEINQARRKVVLGLEKMILAGRRIPPVDGEVFRFRAGKAMGLGTPGIFLKKSGPIPLLAVSVGDLQSVKAAVGSGADVVYYGPGSFRSKPPVCRETLAEAASFCEKKGCALILATPRIVKDGEIKELIEDIEGIPARGVLAGNLGMFPVLTGRLPGLPLISDFGLNAFNRHAVEYLLRTGASRVTLSPELNMEQVKCLAAQYPAEVFIHGSLELMVSEHCLPGSVLGGRTEAKSCAGVCRDGDYSLRDRTGAVFPVEADRHCRMHIFNSRDLCLIDDLSELSAAGVSCVRVEARRERAGNVSTVTEIYRFALDGLLSGGKSRDKTGKLKEKLLTLSPAGITKGHYYRGV